MLSFIVQLATSFEREHGVKANVLYLNGEHFDHLRQDFSDPQDIQAMVERLGMEVVLDRHAVHPHLARQQSAHQFKVAV